jgi:ABC-type transport system involved in multi-copper enzyme maturation permease subunit
LQQATRFNLFQAFNSPLLLQGMRSRFRGVRGPLLLLAGAGVPVLMAGIVVLFSLSSLVHLDAYTAAARMRDLGQSIFAGDIAGQALLAVLLAPVLTATALTGERDAQTLDLLLTSRLTSAEIIVGKLLSALLLLVILQLCAVPVAALALFFGGVSLGQLLSAFCIVLAISVVCAAAGLYSSSARRHTGTSMMSAYFWALYAVMVSMMWLAAPIAIYSLERIGGFALLSLLLMAAVSYYLMHVVAAVHTWREDTPIDRDELGEHFGAGCLLALAGVMALFVLLAISPDFVFWNPLGALIAINSDCLFVRPLYLFLQGYWVNEITFNIGWLHPALVPVVVGLLLAQAWVFLILAAGEVERKRRVE